MTITAATSRRRIPGRPLKSPLAVAGDYRSPEAGPAVDADPILAGVVLSDREATLAEFEDHLRTVNSREGRPYEEKTIGCYVGPAKNPDRWMTASGIAGDFTVAESGCRSLSHASSSDAERRIGRVTFSGMFTHNLTQKAHICIAATAGQRASARNGRRRAVGLSSSTIAYPSGRGVEGRRSGLERAPERAGPSSWQAFVGGPGCLGTPRQTEL
jgi:hypothetical protein